jgi:hypothetical protein
MAQQLHEVAVQAEKALEQLATGLAQAGADDQTVGQFTQMADVCRQTISALGKGQETTGDNEPPEGSDQPHTMDSAADSLMSDVQAQRR